MKLYVATIYLQDACTKIWEEMFDTRDIAEMMTVKHSIGLQGKKLM